MKTAHFVILSIGFFAFSSIISAQSHSTNGFRRPASEDTLDGFDEVAATKASISENFIGNELSVHLAQLKRKYINNRFGITPVQNPPLFYAGKSAAVQAFGNGDFETATAGTITSQNQVPGWTVTSGSHGGTFNSCNLLGCCPGSPSESAVFSTPNGYVDPTIGSIYPIYSVFGTAAGNPGGSLANPHLAQPLKGNNFIRINSSLNNFGIEKISQTFSVTAATSFFQYAFITVFSTGHACCDAGAFQLKITNLSTNSVIACQSLSLSAPSSACTNTSNNVSFLDCFSGNPATPNSAYVFNKWQVRAIDLAPYIGQSINIEVVATDCTAGGHFGYMYFDSQCGPMVINSGSNSLPVAQGQASVFVCPQSTDTLCAPMGMSSYLWNSNSGPAYSTPCITTSGGNNTYTLAMTGNTACSASTSSAVIHLISPPSLTAFTPDTLICQFSSHLVVLHVNGTPGKIHWSTGDTTNYVITQPTTTTIYTVIASDNYGCSAYTSLTVNVINCTGLNGDWPNAINYRVYPNPVGDKLIIETTDNTRIESLILCNTLGQSLMIISGPEARQELDTSQLPRGIYFLRIQSHEGQYALKVMKE